MKIQKFALGQGINGPKSLSARTKRPDTDERNLENADRQRRPESVQIVTDYNRPILA